MQIVLGKVDKIIGVPSLGGRIKYTSMSYQRWIAPWYLPLALAKFCPQPYKKKIHTANTNTNFHRNNSIKKFQMDQVDISEVSSDNKWKKLNTYMSQTDHKTILSIFCSMIRLTDNHQIVYCRPLIKRNHLRNGLIMAMKLAITTFCIFFL